MLFRRSAALAGALLGFPGQPITAASLAVRATLCASPSGDAGTYSQSCDTYAHTINCPNGLQKNAGGVVLLVHGTGSTGSETWDNGPYIQLLPNAGPGFDVCKITLPGRSLGDVQTTSEYVAFAIQNLAAHSQTGMVGIVSHSQGGLNVQWALDFWPSYRSLVSAFVALAGDFHGTGEGPPACLVLDVTTGGCDPCASTVIQQSVGSNFLKALNSRGGVALVPTTSIYTIFDDVIQPELIPTTSLLPGAMNVLLQDYCGPGYIVDHFVIPFASFAYAVAVDALTRQSTAQPASVPKTSCAWLLDDVLLNNFQRGPTILREVVNDATAVITDPKTLKEPPLKSYVCARGDLTTGCT
ncbi:lipase B [Rhodotorula toruloides]|uniref:Lipase B n=1 Tax=Rhodotorula toruloides TaxID=5286 RepID=A0A511KJW8_RHOTO|nr:lipase B [Rhodotorula toruloides]